MYNIIRRFKSVVNFLKLKRNIIPKRVTIQSKDISNMKMANDISKIITEKLKQDKNTHIVVRMGGEGDTSFNRLLTAVALKQSFKNSKGTNSHNRITINYRNHKNVESFYENMITADNISSDDIKRGMKIDASKENT